MLSEHSPAELSSDPTLSIGTGPFKVAEYSKGSKLVLERNEDYDWAPETWGHEGAAYLDEVVIQFVPEPQARIGALTSGQADAVDQVPPLNIPEVESAGDVDPHEGQHGNAVLPRAQPQPRALRRPERASRVP